MREDIELKHPLTAKDAPGWDSFKQIEIIIAAAERFAVKMSMRDLDGLNCVGHLVRVIANKAA
jgi:acyl carrier protein